MKTYNTNNTCYDHERKMAMYGESVGYRIGNSEIFLVYVYPVKQNAAKNHEIIVIEDGKYYINKLTFNLG